MPRRRSAFGLVRPWYKPAPTSAGVGDDHSASFRLVCASEADQGSLSSAGSAAELVDVVWRQIVRVAPEAGVVAGKLGMILPDVQRMLRVETGRVVDVDVTGVA